MRLVPLVVLFVCLAAMPAWAQTPPASSVPAPPNVPSVPSAPTAPSKPVAEAPRLSAAQEARVAERAAAIRKQLADLSPAEQQAVMKQVRPARMPLTDAQRDQLHDQRFARTQANWQAKSPDERADLREKMQKNWQDLSPAEKTYQREKLAERLKALPAADRQQVIELSGK